MSARRFAILFHPRSGSSWLRSVLDANSNFHMLAEPLAERQPGNVQAEFISDFFSQSTEPGIDAIGFKAAPYQIIDKRAFASILKGSKALAIATVREDLLKTSISQLRRGELAKLTKERYGRPMQNRTEEVERPPPSTIDVRALIAQLRRCEIERNDVQFIMEHLGHLDVPTMVVTYEELLGNLEEAIERISRFIATPIPERHSFKPRKNTPDELSEAVANLDEVIGHLKRSQYAHLVEF